MDRCWNNSYKKKIQILSGEVNESQMKVKQNSNKVLRGIVVRNIWSTNKRCMEHQNLKVKN